jgi:hypothetical protein
MKNMVLIFIFDSAPDYFYSAVGFNPSGLISLFQFLKLSCPLKSKAHRKRVSIMSQAVAQNEET